MNLSNQSKEILAALWSFKKTLNQVIPNDLTEYIIDLIIRDQAKQKLEMLIQD